PMALEASAVTFVVTGFSKFSGVEDNPTERLVEWLQQQVDTGVSAFGPGVEIHSTSILRVAAEDVDSYLSSLPQHFPVPRHSRPQQHPQPLSHQQQAPKPPPCGGQQLALPTHVDIQEANPWPEPVAAPLIPPAHPLQPLPAPLLSTPPAAAADAPAASVRQSPAPTQQPQQPPPPPQNHHNHHRNPHQQEPVVLLQLGVAYNASEYRLESRAYNCATFRVPDERGWQPQQQELDPGLGLGCCVGSNLPLMTLKERLAAAGHPVVVSEDAGRFVCNWTYYRACRLAEERRGWQALFVHVPPFEVFGEQAQRRFLLDVIRGIAEELLTQQQGQLAG
ncbi:hypothetical protein Agub_g5648, partial [Astrephomene gubernaculifera]